MSLTAPSRVSGVFVTRTMESGTSSLNVSWTPPQSEVAITEYQVQYKISGTTSWNSATPFSVSPPATSTILTGLDAGTEYNVRVKAVSAVGDGMWSVVQTEKTFYSEFTYMYCLLLSGGSALVVNVRNFALKATFLSETLGLRKTLVNHALCHDV